MKIRVVSDLHIDINNAAPLHLDDDVFTLVAGDVAGNPDLIVKWMRANVKHGAFVSGNHDVYETDLPIEDIKVNLSQAFPVSGDVVYFDNDAGVVSKEIDDNVLLVADVMYTDYQFNTFTYQSSPDNVRRNIEAADPALNFHMTGMNDFNYGITRKLFKGRNDKGTGKGWRLVPEWCLEHFNRAFKAVDEVVSSNPSKDIILMTHHCLSPKCISSEYSRDSLNASYVSDKTEWIHAHPNIKVIVSGHIHSKQMFEEGTAKYVMNPLGYYAYYARSTSTFKFDDVIIDTSDWSVERVKDGLVCSKV